MNVELHTKVIPKKARKVLHDNSVIHKGKSTKYICAEDIPITTITQTEKKNVGLKRKTMSRLGTNFLCTG